jgi:Ni,Fe-hydrogenase III component G
MGLDHRLEDFRTRLGDALTSFERKSDSRVYIDIVPATVVAASRMLLEELGARFQIATGMDTRDGIEVMYHWSFDRDGCLVTTRVLLEHARPTSDSIAPICPAAEWIEREMWELLGIEFRGHPDLRHLLLDDDWPAGDYPLRRRHGEAP